MSDTTRAGTRRGRLIQIMGPSGVGKDALLDYARGRIANPHLLFAHRYVTRPPDAGGENHIALSAVEFATRDQAGLFSLVWHSNSLSYGVGREVDLWLSQGFDVLISGSRSMWPDLCRIYPDPLGILITTDPEIRYQRLSARGRENTDMIKARLAREISPDPALGSIINLDNSGPLSIAGDQLIQILTDPWGAS